MRWLKNKHKLDGELHTSYTFIIRIMQVIDNKAYKTFVTSEFYIWR